MTNLLILTCARSRAEDPWHYIKQTLPLIEREDIGACKRGIVCDGIYGGPRPEGWDVYEFARPTDTTLKTGNKLPYWYLLRVGLQLGGDLLALEDDLVFCKNAVRRMLTFPIPADLHWIQFFSPQILRAWDMFPGLWRPPLSSSSFLQAAKYSPAALERLVNDWAKRPDYIMYGESDQSLAIGAAALGLRYGVHAPDLVQHVGHHSEASNSHALEDWRTSSMWPGEKFDALSLYQRDELYR